MNDARPSHTVQLDERVYRTDMADGPSVLSEKVPGVRSVAVGIWVRWGASHESAALLGISHLLEHMVFKGTERRSAREIALEIEGIGGSLDAYTTREHTAYYARILDEHLPVAVDVLTDLVFRPTLRPRDLEVERNVILEEIAGVEDTPEDLVFDLHARALWGDHPYGQPVLGNRETVARIGVDDLRMIWERAYQPPACVLVAAGNVEHEDLLEQIRRVLPAGGAARLSEVPTPDPAAAGEHPVDRESAQTHTCIGSTLFPHGDPRRYAAVLISLSLGGGMSSRLFQRVREELGLAYSIYSFQSYYRRGGLCGLYMATRPDAAERAIDEIRAELTDLARQGLSAAELESARNQAKGQVVLSLESTSGRAQRLAGVALYDEPYRTLDEICALIDAVDVEDVADLARTYYAPERQVIVRLGPDAEDAAGGGSVGLESASMTGGDGPGAGTD